MCLPTLPLNLEQLNVSDNVKCMPNTVLGLQIYVYDVNNNLVSRTLPLCSTLSNDPCEPTYKLSIDNIYANRPLSESTLLLNGSTNLSTIKVAADGSIGTLLKITGDVRNKVIRFKNNADNPTMWGKLEFKQRTDNEVVYYLTHPSIIPIPPNISYSPFEVYDNVGQRVVREFGMSISPPPLLLVHGLNSNGSTWTDLKNNLVGNNYLPASLISTPNLPNDQSFDPTYQQIGSYIDILFEETLRTNISVGKLDIVGHSMGGILSRLYLQNMGNQRINKLITLNTPHSGAAIANYLQEPSVSAALSTPFIKALSYVFAVVPNPYSTAVRDLQIGSIAINSLNGASLNTYIVPCHAIHTKKALVTYNGSYCTIASNEASKISKRDAYLNIPINLTCIGTENILNAAIFKDENGNPDTHDRLVTTKSQMGGLTGANTSLINDLWHIESTSNTGVANKVLELLKADLLGTQFSQTGFHPVVLRYISPPSRITSPQHVNSLPFIAIDPALKGRRYSKGEILTINVTSSSDIQKVALLTGTNKSDSLTFVYRDGSPFTFSYQIPNDFEDTVKLVVLAQPNANTVVSDSSYIIISNVVPVELLNFTGMPLNKMIQLNWQTASEKNANYFDVEQSNDGKIFEKIGQVKSSGNSTALRSYNFIDEKPFNKVNYYRLRQIDFDGTAKVSNTIAVAFGINTKLQVFPNPAKNTLTILSEATGDYIIFDIIGREILRGALSDNRVDVDVSILPTGMYLVKTKDESVKFFKE
jgi:pimeloyl-ACP methyl ester carboxylesterase